MTSQGIQFQHGQVPMYINYTIGCIILNTKRVEQSYALCTEYRDYHIWVLPTEVYYLGN